MAGLHLGLRKLSSPYPQPSAPAQLGQPSSIQCCTKKVSSSMFMASRSNSIVLVKIPHVGSFLLFATNAPTQTFLSNGSILRYWAFNVLKRCSELFGEDYVSCALQRQQQVMTMFSGVECARKAWEHISYAALELWGIRCGLIFTCAVPGLYHYG